jgi:hypothetical protein
MDKKLSYGKRRGHSASFRSRFFQTRRIFKERNRKRRDARLLALARPFFRPNVFRNECFIVVRFHLLYWGQRDARSELSRESILFLLGGISISAYPSDNPSTVLLHDPIRPCPPARVNDYSTTSISVTIPHAEMDGQKGEPSAWNSGIKTLHDTKSHRSST